MMPTTRAVRINISCFALTLPPLACDRRSGRPHGPLVQPKCHADRQVEPVNASPTADVGSGMRPSLRRGVPVILTATLLLAVAAEGGQLRWKWWQSDEFRRELRLTPEQVERIDQVFQASLLSLQAGKGDLDRLERELSTVIADSAATEAQV